MKRWGGIEAGGTKFVCAVVGEDGKIITETRFPTTTPDETLARTIDFFREQEHEGALSSIGIGAFGPVDLDPSSAQFGFITTTPKPNWSFVDLKGTIARGLQKPVVMDTDVNAAAYGEFTLCEHPRQDDPLVYMTVGTGVGVGVIVNGRPLHGLIHPEVGHTLIPHDRVEDPFEGGCPYHGDCLEGLAAGPAMRRRWGVPAEQLPDDHPAWALECRYISLAVSNLICTLSPRLVVLGGGVLQRAILYPMIRSEVARILNDYVKSDRLTSGLDQYIIAPTLGNYAGVLGAVALARDFLE